MDNRIQTTIRLSQGMRDMLRELSYRSDRPINDIICKMLDICVPKLMEKYVDN